jgi:hypothetical protein
LNEANINAQDIKDTTGIQDASLGMRSNEVSGKAIMARQREGDVATITYHDNLNEAIQEAGDVINQLIPIAYDTMRTLRITGHDDKMEMITANDPQDEASPDLTQGKYDTMVITGPSYTTQRMEAAESMMQAIQVYPQLMEVAGDLIVRAQDWPNAEEISERLKKMLPAAQEEKDPADMTPEEQAAAAEAAQMQQMQQEMAMRMAAAELSLKEAEAAKLAAEAEEAQAKAKQETLRAMFMEQNGGEEAVDPALATAELRTAEANARAAEAKAEEAEAKARAAAHSTQIEEDNVEFNRALSTVKIAQAAQPKPAAGAPSNGKAGPRPSARPATGRKAQ